MWSSRVSVTPLRVELRFDEDETLALDELFSDHQIAEGEVAGYLHDVVLAALLMFGTSRAVHRSIAQASREHSASNRRRRGRA